MGYNKNKFSISKKKEDGRSFPMKTEIKIISGSNIYIIQNRQKLGCNKRKRTLHNDKGINPRKARTIVNIYAANLGAPKYTKQLLTNIKGELDSNTIILEILKITYISGQIIQIELQ